MKLFLYCFRDFDEKPHFDNLIPRFNYTYDATDAYPDLNNANLAAGYDAISTTPSRLDKTLLDKFHSLGIRYILNRSIGVDHVDLEVARQLGMRVGKVSYEPHTVANYAIMLMMMCLRNMRLILDQAALQNFTLRGKIGRDISSCTVGVIGTGQIGATVIRHLHAFGCRIIAYDRYQNKALDGMCEYVDLENLYAESDVISLHIPSDASNHHLINTQAFELMKKGVVVINTARGPLIDTDALIDALESGQVGSAALDVLEDENGLYYHNRMGECIGNRQMAQLRACPNVILSPHTAFYSHEVVRSMAEHTIQNFFDMTMGKTNPLIVV